jgi:hypothetical protein
MEIPMTASANLEYIAGRLQVLESCVQNCPDLRDIGIVLKYLSGTQLIDEEKEYLQEISEDTFFSDDITQLVYALAPHDKMNLNQAINSLVNKCGHVKNVPFFYPAAANFLDIAQRVKELEYLYSEAKNLSRGLENQIEVDIFNLIIGRLLTFNEIMNGIDIYLKFLADEPIEMDNNYIRLLASVSDDNIWDGKLDTDDTIELSIRWLNSVLNDIINIFRQQHQQRFQQVGEQMSYIPPGMLNPHFPGGQEFWKQTGEFFG